jgi:hypothetical protein
VVAVSAVVKKFLGDLGVSKNVRARQSFAFFYGLDSRLHCALLRNRYACGNDGNKKHRVFVSLRFTLYAPSPLPSPPQVGERE